MSVVDLDKVDGMGLMKDGKHLLMMIGDHLDWEDEEIHLEILQDKINAYVAYIESGEWKSRYPDDLQGVIITINFLYEIPENCEKFLQTVQDQLGQYCIRIEAVVQDEDFRREFLENQKRKEASKRKFRFPFFRKK